MKEHPRKESQLPSIIIPRYISNPNFVIPTCMSFQLAHVNKISPELVWHNPLPEEEFIFYRDKYKTGVFVSSDQFVMKTSVQLPSGFVREGPNSCFHGGTIFNDDTTGIIWVDNHISLGSGETVTLKKQFEEWLWKQYYVEVQHYHGYNRIINAYILWKYCAKRSQYQSCSGTGSQNQNTRAECVI